jgi:GT2 family glycosyltransferase
MKTPKKFSPNPKVAIIIPTWNGLHLLKQSLDAVMSARKNYSGICDVVVIDNGSQDRTVDVIKDYYPEILLIENEINIGFGAACNIGASAVETDLLLFLNNDIFIKENFVESLILESKKLKDFFSLCPQTNYWNKDGLSGDVFSSSINFSFTDNQELIQHWAVNNFRNIAEPMEPTIYGTGAAILINKKKFDALGGFDAVYGLAYWEDVDLCVRAWAVGWASYCASSVVAWHMISATSKNQESDVKSGMMKKNYIIFQLIHLPNISSRITFLRHLIQRTSKDFLLKQNIPYLAIMKRVIFNFMNKRMSIIMIIEKIPRHSQSWSSGRIF